MNNLQKWILFLGIITITLIMIITGKFHELIILTGSFGIIGVLISGIFFGYGFTAIPATASLIYFTELFNPIIIAFIGATGTMIGDLIIFNYFRNSLPDEIESLIKKSKIRKLKKTRFKWLVPAIAGFIIASPLPDEIGVSLLGTYKFDTNTFMLISFTLNFIGLLIITGAFWIF